MKGVPLRLELGPRDIENNQCVLVRRDNGEKTVVNLDNLEEEVARLLEAVRDGLYNKALANRTEKTYEATTMEEMIEIADTKPGFIKAMWCEDRACEEALKEKAGVSSRCMPFEQDKISDKCVCCGKPAKQMVFWGKAY
jgi:prolyl-tRNA synthetase